MSLATPQSGQVKSSGMSSHLVSGRDAFFGIALFLVVFPAADRANVFHDFYLRNGISSEFYFVPPAGSYAPKAYQLYYKHFRDFVNSFWENFPKEFSERAFRLTNSKERAYN